MGTASTVRISAATAAEVCLRFDVPPAARALLADGMEPREFAAALVANKQYAAAVDFLAHGLPAREGVWWAYLCLEHACGVSLSGPELAAVAAGVRWVLQPGEENRAAAKAGAEAVGLGSLPGLLAMAVFQSGVNSGASARSVAVAVKLAATKGDPAKLFDTQRLFVNLGLEVAGGSII